MFTEPPRPASPFRVGSYDARLHCGWFLSLRPRDPIGGYSARVAGGDDTEQIGDSKSTERRQVD